MTVGIGVARGDLGREATADSLVAAADGALYRAQHAGRNHVASEA